MKHKGFLTCLFGWRSLTEKVMEVKTELNRRLFQHGKIGQESVNPLGYGVMKGDYSHSNYPMVAIGQFIYTKGYF